jgi:hypothetical protein
MEGGSFTGDFSEKGEVLFLSGICKRWLWKRADLSIGALLGNLEGGSFTGACQIQ